MATKSADRPPLARGEREAACHDAMLGLVDSARSRQPLAQPATRIRDCGANPAAPAPIMPAGLLLWQKPGTRACLSGRARDCLWWWRTYHWCGLGCHKSYPIDTHDFGTGEPPTRHIRAKANIGKEAGHGLAHRTANTAGQ